MHDIHHDVIIDVKPIMVYRSITTAKGLNSWWTKDAEGFPELNYQYRFYFSEDYDWSAKVTALEENNIIEWTMTDSDPDWDGTLLRFELIPTSQGTKVRFSHTGWQALNDHHRRTSYCWALYLRLLKRYLELGEIVPYHSRNI